MLNNTLQALAVLFFILLSSFALYLPLVKLLGDKRLALKFAIPISISIEIIIGYIFYCLNVATLFPVAYLVLVLTLNFIAIRQIGISKIISLKMPLFKTLAFFASLIVILSVVYSRYYDSFSFISPGGNDTYNHAVYVKDLINQGYLSNGFYAPGFHLFMMPIAKIISGSSLFRFGGGAIGIITIISMILLFRDQVKHKVSILLMVALLTFPVYNSLTLQTTQFFSSALTFIFFASFIALSDQEFIKSKSALLIFSIICLALAFTVPYFFINLLPAFILFCLITFFFRKKLSAGYSRYIFILTLIVIGGLAASMLHVVIQSTLLKRYSGFPNIPVAVEKSSDDLDTLEKVDSQILTQNIVLPRWIQKNTYIKPILGASIDLIKVKNFRPANSMLGLGGYIWIAFSLFLIFFASHKKNGSLLAVGALSLVFGVSTQTGMIEMTYYRGRTGWYLLLLSLIGTVIFLDEVTESKYAKLILISSALLSICAFIKPPTFYRPFYEKEFETVKGIANMYHDRRIKLIASERHLPIVADNLTRLDLDPINLSNDNSVIVIEKNVFSPNPVLSQMAVSTDKGLTHFNKWLSDLKQKNNLKNEAVFKSSRFSDFKKIYDSPDFEIYSNI